MTSLVSSRLPLSKKALMVTFLALFISRGANAELIIQSPSHTAVTVSQSVKPLPVIPPSDASITRLMQVLHVDAMIDEMVAQQQQIATAVQTMPKQLPKDDKPSILSKVAQHQLQKILAKYGQVLGEPVDPAKRRAELVAIYHTAAKQHYSQAEVDALIGFYETPMGQQLLQKQSLVSMDFLKNSIPTMAGGQREWAGILPTLEQDMAKIFE